MKVAIVGAGLSGLSCAFELKKHGITPTIFEKNTVLGDSLDYAVSNFKIMTNFYTSPRKYFKKNYGLDIVPVGMLKKIININRDSLAPVINFYKKDIEKIIESIEWN